jgi:peptide/nickel transport system substrate-binding protein
MIEYDVDQANAYLDEMGLTERDGDGYRLMPNGERLTIVLEYAPIFGSWGAIAELLSQQYQAIGLELIPKEMSRQLNVQRFQANEQDMHIWTSNGEFGLMGELRTFIQFQIAPYNAWRNSGGTEGEEPPEYMRKQYELWDEVQVTLDSDKQAELIRQVLEIHKEQMVTIGACTAPPEVVVTKNSFRNVPADAVSDWPLLSPGNTIVEQYFIRQG